MLVIQKDCGEKMVPCTEESKLKLLVAKLVKLGIYKHLTNMIGIQNRSQVKD